MIHHAFAQSIAVSTHDWPTS